MRILLLLVLAGAALAQAPAPSKPYASLADLMAGILFPFSNTIFDVTKHAPQNDREWTAVQTSAAVLAETGTLILARGRLKENGQPVPPTADFRKHVQALVEAAKGAHKAALSKNVDAVFAACEPLYQACFTCHEAYRFCPTCQEPETPAPGAKQ
jgi:soluble cytochrome b562